MEQMSAVKKSMICAICIALCYVLPMAFHAIGTGSVFLPMHIPVFICALICGWSYGMLCGISGPAISCILTGMPTVAGLPGMMAELCVYGLIAGLLMRFIRTKSTYADLYVSLIIAIIAGRVTAGLINALIFARGMTYTIAAWASAYLFTSWPGTVIQLVFIPTIILALMKAHLIPERYHFETEREIS